MKGCGASLQLVIAALLCLAACPVWAEDPSALLQFNGEQGGESFLSEPLFKAPKPATHPGLLGQRFLSAAYLYGNTGGLIADDFLEHAHGFDLKLNLPVIPGDGTQPFAMDGFVNYRQFFLNDDINVGPMTITGDGDFYQVDVGLTLYTQVIPRMRPFMQLGWGYGESNFKLTSSTLGSMDLDDSDNSMVLDVGTEIDLSEWVAFRATLDIDTEEFDSSTFIGEFITSPTDRTFFRFGGFADLDGDFYGAIVGGGVKF